MGLMAFFKILPAAALAGVLLSAQASLAAEGGFSFYLPGSAGDIALAQSAEPGDLQIANTVYFLSGDAGAARDSATARERALASVPDSFGSRNSPKENSRCLESGSTTLT